MAQVIVGLSALASTAALLVQMMPTVLSGAQ
jgi:hypothetical protein